MTDEQQKEQQSGLDFACWIGQLLDKKGGLGILVYDVRSFSTITDFMVIVTGTSLRHMETLIEAPCSELKKSGFPAHSIEGKGTHWVIADLDDVVLHVFDEAARQHFNLEELWAVCPKVNWQQQPSAPHPVFHKRTISSSSA